MEKVSQKNYEMIVDAHSHFLPKEYAMLSPFYKEAWYNFELRQQIRTHSSNQSIEILTYPLAGLLENSNLRDIPREIIDFNNIVARISENNQKVFATAALYPPVGSHCYIAEMKRAVEELELCGFSIASSYQGVYLDNDLFWPLYEKSIELDVPIFVHPMTSRPIGYERLGDYELTAALGFAFDTTTAITRLVASGLLKRFKGVKLVFAGLGGTFPFLLPRISSIFEKNGFETNDIKQSLENIYFDTCTTDIAILELAVKTLGADKLLLGTDFPVFKDINLFVNAIKRLDVAQEEKEAILYKNSVKLIQKNFGGVM